MSEVCYGVGIELGLQPITEEHLSLGSVNKEGGVWLDIVVENFRGENRHRAFFDIRVFNPFAQSHCKKT